MRGVRKRSKKRATLVECPVLEDFITNWLKSSFLLNSMILFRKMNWALLSCWEFPQLHPPTLFCSYWQVAVKGLKTECSTCTGQNSWAAPWIVSQLELMVFNPIKELGKGGSLGSVCYENISLDSVVPSAGKDQTPSETVMLFAFFNVYILCTQSHSNTISVRARNKTQCCWPSV